MIGDEFNGRCPICSNKLQGGDYVYEESGDAFWDYYRWYCPKCGSVTLEEKITKLSAFLDARNNYVDEMEMSSCPRCGCDGDFIDAYWDNNGTEVDEVHRIRYECPCCHIKYEAKEIYDSVEDTIYAVKDKTGKIQMNYERLVDWRGPRTTDYL